MSNINIPDLDAYQDSTLFAECSSDEASAIVGSGILEEILKAMGEALKSAARMQ